jgi:alpha-glucosidase
LGFLQRLRALLDSYPNTTMVGEIGDDDGLARVAEYTRGGDKLHMAYCFDLLGTAHSSQFFHGVIKRFEAIAEGGWPCWALSNHDVVRFATRWGGSQPNLALLKLGAAMQFSLRGSSCIYQGDELGLPEADIAFEDLQDPYGITMWPEFKGRDGCRTPMPWNSTPKDLGFSAVASQAKSWLPVVESHRALAVDVQDGAPDSLLSFYRALLKWRKTQTALIDGEIELLPVDQQVFAFIRCNAAQRVLCVFNFSANPVQWALPSGIAVQEVLPVDGLHGASYASGVVGLQPWSGMFASVA